MKKICYVAILAAGLCSMQNALLAQGTPPAPDFANLPSTSVPKIKFEKTVWDFGKVTGGDTVQATFVFTNTGGKTLEVTGVQTSCGCTTAGEWTRKVEPGQTGIIPLKFNTGTYNGQIIKTATVSNTDPVTPQVTLQLKTDIWRAIEVAPQIAVLQLTSETPSNAATVKIINNLDTPLMLSDVESKSPAFAAELKTLKEGKEYELQVRTVAPFPANNASGQVTIKSSSTNMPVISVTAFANVQPTVAALPSQITLPQAPLTNAITQTIFFRNNSSNNVEVTNPTINVKGAEVKLTPIPQQRYFTVAVTFPVGTTINPADKPALTVKTTHPLYPEINVPIIQPPVAMIR